MLQIDMNHVSGGMILVVIFCSLSKFFPFLQVFVDNVDFVKELEWDLGILTQMWSTATKSCEPGWLLEDACQYLSAKDKYCH